MYKIQNRILAKQQQQITESKRILPGRAGASQIVNNTTNEIKEGTDSLLWAEIRM